MGCRHRTRTDGYLLAAADGGVFAFGDAGFYGSLGSIPQSRAHRGHDQTPTVVGTGSPTATGPSPPFGDATYWGSTPQVLAAPVVGIAEAPGNGPSPGPPTRPAATATTSRTTSAATSAPAPHRRASSRSTGASFGASIRVWPARRPGPGPGLNLYIFLTYGTSTDAAPGCATSVVPDVVQLRFGAGVHAFDEGAGGRGQHRGQLVARRREPAAGSSGPAYQAANAALVQGSIDALHAEGINSVGIYASPGVWPGIVGDYEPAVPYWAADWGPAPAATCGDIHSKFRAGPACTGPVEIVQYGIGVVNGTEYDEDYAC